MPKFLEVERLNLIAVDQRGAIAKTREVLEEVRGGILKLFILHGFGKLGGSH